MTQVIKKGQQYEDIRLPFSKLTVLKILSNGMLLVKKTCTTSYGEEYLNYNTKLHLENLRLAYRLIK